MSRKGIILAGGTGSRLFPITKSMSKQLLPVYDKPMIYYPLSTLMLAGIREILVITNPGDSKLFQALLGDGSKWGISIQYAFQEKPQGIAQAFLIAKSFLDGHPSVLILGDNLFHGYELLPQLFKASRLNEGATVFAYPVADPSRYGVIAFNSDGIANSIEEKPINPRSRYAITGLYFYDSSVIKKATVVKPSNRGEFEITDINKMYLQQGLLKVELMGRGTAWLDTGTFDSLHDASSYIKTLELRQGLKVGCPEEIAWIRGWITDDQLKKLANPLLKSGYGNYLLNLLEIDIKDKRYLSQYYSEKYEF